MKLKNGLLGTSAVLSGAMLLTAQEAVAQSASAQAMLEEVVVTARRREENLQDLPLSIAAINADAMQAQGIHSIEDVSDFVPNVTLTQSDRAANTRVIIRGIGGGHPDPAFVFGSGMYIDGHYIPNSLGGYMSTMDIERVELLRGPQGTLFGKNVTGGAVNIISAKPGPDFDSSVTLRAAEDGDNDFRGMVNFPISDNVFARVGFAKEVFDGYYYNRHLDVQTGGEDRSSLNAAIRFTPGNWTIDVNTFLIRNRDDNKGGQCNIGDGQAPQWGGGTGHLERVYVGFSDDFMSTCDPSNPNSDVAQGTFVNSSDKLTFADIDQEVVLASAQWNSDGAVGGLEDLSVKISGSYRYNDYYYLQDRDYQFYDVDVIGEFGAVGQDNWTRGAELLVEGTVSDRLEFTAGINYFYEEAKNGDGRCRELFANSVFSDSVTNPAFTAWQAMDPATRGEPPLPIIPAVGDGSQGFDCDAPSGLYFELLPEPRINGGGPGPFLNSEWVENESIGVFGHLTYALNDNWDLDVGARWTEDDRSFWNMETATEGCVAESGDGDDPQSARVLGDPSTTGRTGICDVGAWFMSWNNVIGNGFFNAASETFDEITPMISLTRNLAGGDTLDSGMWYVLYSEGFLTGGFNPELNANVPGTATLLTYEPENVKNYEVGFKGTLMDGRVRIMADVFYMDYTNRQDQIDIPNPDGTFGIDDPLGVVQNVSSVDVRGVEFELRASPWDGGFVSLDVGFLDNEYGEYTYPNPTATNDPDACPAGQASGDVCDLSNTLINDLTADWTLSLGVEHEFQLANGGTLTPRLNVYASDGIEYQEGLLKSESPGFCYQDSYERIGARLTYVPPAGNWQASLFGNNITDEEIYERCGESRGVYNYRHERPAWWGLEFQARWGAGAN